MENQLSYMFDNSIASMDVRKLKKIKHLLPECMDMCDRVLDRLNRDLDQTIDTKIKE